MDVKSDFQAYSFTLPQRMKIGKNFGKQKSVKPPNYEMITQMYKESLQS